MVRSYGNAGKLEGREVGKNLLADRQSQTGAIRSPARDKHANRLAAAARSFTIYLKAADRSCLSCRDHSFVNFLSNRIPGGCRNLTNQGRG